MNTTSGYLQPALTGGIVAGVLSALPVVSAGNACCCLWIVAGGLTAAYLLQQNREIPITAADGAIVGLLAGVIGAFVQLVLSIPISLIVGPMEREMLERFSEVWGTIGGSGDVFGGYDQGPAGGVLGVIIFSIIAFFFTLVVGSMVSTIAGLVGAALFAKKSVPRPATDDFSSNS